MIRISRRRPTIADRSSGGLHLPGWVRELSLFHHYGQQVTHGFDGRNTLEMTAVAVALRAIALVRFTRRDLRA
jgi:putative exporter of polyketide antibiotics